MKPTGHVLYFVDNRQDQHQGIHVRVFESNMDRISEKTVIQRDNELHNIQCK